MWEYNCKYQEFKNRTKFLENKGSWMDIVIIFKIKYENVLVKQYI